LKALRRCAYAALSAGDKSGRARVGRARSITRLPTCEGQFIGQTGLDDKEDTNPEMRTATGAAHESAPPADTSAPQDSDDLLKLVTFALDEAKAENIVTIDLKGKSSIGDYMVVATGRTDRHVGAVAEQLQRKLREAGHVRVRIEGEKQCDWVLIDAGPIIVHVFRPEVREFYNLEKMWSQSRASEPTAH